MKDGITLIGMKLDRQIPSTDSIDFIPEQHQDAWSMKLNSLELKQLIAPPHPINALYKLNLMETLFLI